MVILSPELRLKLRDISAVALGSAVPALVLGRAVFAIALLIGFICLLVSGSHKNLFHLLIRQVSGPIGFLITLTIVVWSISALDSTYPVRSLEAVLRTGLFIVISWMIFSALNTDGVFHALFSKTIIIGAAISTGFAIFAIAGMPELYWFIKLKGWQSVGLETELKGYSSLSIIMLPALLVAAARLPREWTVAIALISAGMSFLVWETYNRAALAGFLGFVLVWIVFWSMVERSFFRLFSAWSSFFLIFFSAIYALWRSRNYMITEAPAGDWLYPLWLIDFQRQTIWNEALKIAGSSPWLGVGANTINFAPGAEKPLPGQEGINVIPAHPHNWLVEMISETGFFGATLLMLTILVFFLTLIKMYKRQPSLGIIAAASISGSYWVSGLFNFSYWSAWWQMTFFLLSGYCLALALNSNLRRGSSGGE